MRKFLVCILVMVFILYLNTAFALQELSLLDESDQVASLKLNLITLGYLDESENESKLFNKRTKDAVISLQQDFGLDESGVATKEIQVITQLLARLEGRTEVKPTEPPKPKMPDLKNMKRADAIVSLQALGQLPIITEIYSDSVQVDYVVRTMPTSGQALPDNKRITVEVSKGPKSITADYCTWYARWFKGSKSDSYEMYYPHIEDGYLYIELDATINTTYKYRWRGYGTASVRDTFDKVVPFNMTYETEDIKKGKTQRIVLKIPIKDLEVQKPTTISVRIELYRNTKTEDQLRMDFTMTWP